MTAEQEKHIREHYEKTLPHGAYKISDDPVVWTGKGGCINFKIGFLKALPEETFNEYYKKWFLDEQ